MLNSFQTSLPFTQTYFPTIATVWVHECCRIAYFNTFYKLSDIKNTKEVVLLSAPKKNTQYLKIYTFNKCFACKVETLPNIMH